MTTKRTWAIAGVSAALILVPAGASYAVTTAADDVLPAAIERAQLREHAQDPSGDYTRDQVRDQLRDTENCDGDGPMGAGHMGDGHMGDGPHAGDHEGHGGMMGGYGSGR